MAEREKTLRLATAKDATPEPVPSDKALTEKLPKLPGGGGATLASADTIASGPGASDPGTSDPGVVRDVEAELASHDPTKRYEHVTLLGEGGMGEVRLCKDKHIVRDVAMKVMRHSSEERSDLRARFLREARVQGQLEHPAIVPVYDLGRDANGNAYFTMRRIRGETLEAIVEKLKSGSERDDDGEYARHKLLAVFQRVCLAVDYAHKKGVIHRDLKPGNIMIGSYGEVYVLDWGLAKLMTPEDQKKLDDQLDAEPVKVSSSGISATEVGQVMGTPGYMAPEQILGQTAEVSARSDIYALGSILFELLTYLPLCGTGSATDVLMRAVRGVDARASERAPDRNVPPELDDVCVRATMAAARDRYQSARELHDAVDGYLAGDRDMARRRELAEEHTNRAKEAKTRALESGSEEDRKSALYELGRALALDPANAPALGTLVDMLTEPPKKLPEEVNKSILEANQESIRTALFTGAGVFFFGSFATWVPFWLASLRHAGAHNWGCAGLVDLTWLAAAAACFYFWRKPSPIAVPIIGILTMSACGALSILYGPLLVVPTIAAGCTVSFVVSGNLEHRRFAIACGLLPVAVPYALEVFGVLPPSVVVEGGVLKFVPRVFDVDPYWTPLFLLTAQLVSIGLAAKFVARYRDAFLASERRVHLQAWQLRQLVPDGAKGAFDSAAPGNVFCTVTEVHRELKKSI
jgi:serine/threonine-protein kinase